MVEKLCYRIKCKADMAEDESERKSRARFRNNLVNYVKELGCYPLGIETTEEF